MSVFNDSSQLILDYDIPAWIVTAIGLGLGAASLGYLLTNPEPLSIWLIELVLVAVPVTGIVYSGYWITTTPFDRKDRWVVAIWALIGATIAAALAVGFLLSVSLDGEVVNDAVLHILVGTLTGSLVALLAVISAQRRYVGSFTAYSDDDQMTGTGTSTSTDAASHASARTDTGSTIGAGARHFVTLLHRAAEIYRENGLRSVASSASRVQRRKLADLGLVRRKPYHERIRSDSTERWETIVPHIGADETSALDIGCASGFFTQKLAENGSLSIGIDIKRERLQTAKQIWGEKEGLGFVLYHLDPDNVSALPSVDVVLLLTVYHHWCEHFGREDAQQMMREVASKSNKLFFEGPGRTDKRFPLVGERPISDDESTVDYYSSLLTSVFDDRVEIEYLGEAPYPHSTDRTDYMFLIECREYT